MADIGLPPQNPGLPYETTQPKTEIVKPAPKIKSKLPEYIQNQANEIINQTKEKKEITLKIESVFEALENRYPNFDRAKFKIEISGITKEDIEYLGYEVFLLYSKTGNLLSYIKHTGETILDMTTFNPYLDSFEKSMLNYIGIEIGKGEDGKWYIKDGNGKWQETRSGKKYKKNKTEILKEGDTGFDRYIISKYVLKE